MSIEIKVHSLPQPSTECIGTVRVMPEAEVILRRVARETGLSVRFIVSQIIIEADRQGIEVTEV